MSKLRILLLLLPWSAQVAGPPDAPSVDLTRRIEAQRSIARFYQAHRVGSSRSLDEAVSAVALERHVHTTLKLSVALDEIWHRPVTAQALEVELERIARNTRFPERLQELYAVLDDDPLLILETVARPTLVRRRAHELFDGDARIHAEGELDWDAWWGRTEPTLDEHRVQPLAMSIERVPRPAAADAAPCVSGEGWDNGLLDRVPGGREGHAAVWTGSEMLVWGGQDDDQNYLAEGYRYDPLLQVWTAMSTAGEPVPRMSPRGVWSGSELIVWGGYDGSYLQSGGRYDPMSDSWSPVTSTAAPSGRSGHAAVWTGSKMIVWGGADAAPPAPPVATGGRYDPVTDSWSATTTTNAPTGRTAHTAVWTGSEMIVWSGADSSALLDSGGRYDPGSDVWIPTSTFQPPRGRYAHSAVWTGDRMVVWGGIGQTGPTASGSRYDPLTDAWTPTQNAPVVGTPTQRAVWTGDRMVVLGTNPGPAKYDPVGNVWTVIAPQPGYAACCGVVWTGTEVLSWGNGQVNEVGGRYDPLLDSWAPMTPFPGAPDARGAHTAVWTGSEMIVWGGLQNQVFKLDTGSRYDPLLDTWTPTSMLGAPAARYAHVAFWTGDEMLIWGGATNGLGGRYDPASDSWRTMSSAGDPFARQQLAGVWTGSKMIVWGGEGGSGVEDTGGVYDPASDSWTATSQIGAPSRRFAHRSVWTGSEMILWGGVDTESGTPQTLADGARYDPVSDTWTPVSTIDAPGSRLDHTAVWTGSEMMVWGGNRDFATDLDDGGRYDPVTDTWSSLGATAAPSERFRHRAVWTGSKMIVWGGRLSDGTTYDDGAIYAPGSDLWSPTSTAGAPYRSNMHTALWAGDSMFVWGGFHVQSYLEHNTGGRYVFNPDDDGDGAGASCDCAPGDATVFATPQEISAVAFADAVTLSWSTDAANSGTGTLYEVVRGDLAALPVGSGAGETCLVASLTSTSAAVPGQPEGGAGFFYLVRGRNGCGVGSYGSDSGGAERLTTACR